MNQTSAPVGEDPLRPWELGFLALLVAALLAAFWIKSHKEYLGHDEFVTAVLAANPSLSQTLDTIRHGGETNPPLYFILEWLVARIFGTGETALRAISAVSVALAGVVTFFTLRRVTGPVSAARAVALVFGLSRGIFWYMIWARYYGLLVLLGALAAWLFVKLNTAETVTRRDAMWLFLVNAAMVYLHLFGLLFSGMFLVAQLAMDWLRGRWRWKIYAAVVGAWAAFLFWVPALPNQFYITSAGTWTPRMKFGLFVEEPAMQTPLGLVFLLLAVVAVAALLGRREQAAPPAGNVAPGLVALLALALAWMVVMLATWAASQVMKPVYLQRYVAPCAVALTLLLAVVVWALERLPQVEVPLAARAPGWLSCLVGGGVLGFCLLFQPIRAIQDAPKPPAPFTDLDFGHPNVPIVLEDSMDFLPRAWYGRGREYILWIDHDAAEASSGWFTKQMERYYSRFRAHHPELKVRYTDELPAGPDGFLVVDVPHATTFEWVREHRPEFKAEKLGEWPGGQQVFWVRRTAK